jgi:hypothetical protein
MKMLFVVLLFANGQTDQERCQMEADYMAKHQHKGHVFGTIGRFEGVGWGRGDKPPTCVPDKQLTLTGDAATQGQDGLWYRVRSWR